MPAVPHQSYPVDKDSEWTFTAEEGNALIERGWDTYKAAHTWFDSASGSTPETKDAYKLPHHKLKGGTMTTFKRGVVAAVVRLAGADIPEGDKSACRDHLYAHYKELDMEPPSEKVFAAGPEAVIKFHQDRGDLPISLLAPMFKIARRVNR